MKLRNLLVSTSLFTLFFTASAIAEPSFEYNYQSHYHSQQLQNINILKPWADSFAEKTNGDFIMNFYPLGGFVDSNEVERSVISGMLDVAGWGATMHPKEYPHMAMFILPSLTKNSVHGTKLFRALYNQIPGVKAEVDSKGIFLANWCSPVKGFVSTKEPIRSMADLKGKRVLYLTYSDVASIEAWGGIPVSVGPSDVYIGLQRGMGDVFYCAVPFFRGIRIVEIAKYFTPVPSDSGPMVISMNKTAFNDLPKKYQQLVLDSSADISMNVAQSLDADVEGVYKEFRAAGIEIIELNPQALQEFENAVAATIDSYWVEQITKWGVQGDVKQIINKYYEIADSIPGE